MYLRGYGDDVPAPPPEQSLVPIHNRNLVRFSGVMLAIVAATAIGGVIWIEMSDRKHWREQRRRDAEWYRTQVKRR